MELPIIVGEIGLNANGSVERAKKIIQMVVDAANSQAYPRDKVLVKFQKRDVESSTPDHMKTTMRVSPVSGNYMTYLEYRHEIEFGLDAYTEIDHFCKTLGIQFFVSVWDMISADFVLANFPDMPYIKIPSPHITNLVLIRQAALHDGGLIISTGMSDADMVQDAFSEAFMRSTSLTMLACVSTYPTPNSDLELNRIKTLQRLYGSYAAVGYSGHSSSPFPHCYAMALGAQMIEAHVCLSRDDAGSDMAASLERPAVELLFREAMRVSVGMGSGELRLVPSELEKARSLRGN